MGTDLVISRLDKLRLMLAEAKDIQSTKKVLDAVTATGIYARQQGLSDDIIGQAHSIKIDALAQLGEILRATPKNEGAKGIRKKSAVPEGNRILATLSEIGITKKESALAQQISGLPKRIVKLLRTAKRLSRK